MVTTWKPRAAQIGDYRSAKNYFRDDTRSGIYSCTIGLGASSYPDWLRRGDNFEAVQ
jgi:hypothetical protein